MNRLALGLVLLSAGACGGNQSPLNPQGPAARSLADLWWVLLSVSVVVYVLVLGAMFWAIARRRRESDDRPETTRRLGWVVAGATAVTTAILIVLTVSSVVAGRGLISPSGPGAVTVNVVGRQWWWDFQYQDITPSEWVSSPNELHVPVGVPVVLKAYAPDVIHSFWVPNLQGKRDLIPGQITQFWLQADTPGVYRGQCAEFCGQQHAHMAFLVVAEPMEKFRTWIEGQRRSAAEPATDLQRRGRDVFEQAPCVLCHTIRGTAAGSRVGPDLTHVGSRAMIAAGTLPNTRGHLAGWIVDSQSIKPGNRMPPNSLAAGDLQAVLAYLRSLR